MICAGSATGRPSKLTCWSTSSFVFAGANVCTSSVGSVVAATIEVVPLSPFLAEVGFLPGEGFDAEAGLGAMFAATPSRGFACQPAKSAGPKRNTSFRYVGPVNWEKREGWSKRPFHAVSPALTSLLQGRGGDDCVNCEGHALDTADRARPRHGPCLLTRVNPFSHEKPGRRTLYSFCACSWKMDFKSLPSRLSSEAKRARASHHFRFCSIGRARSRSFLSAHGG
jgi:hypothetical protein